MNERDFQCPHQLSNRNQGNDLGVIRERILLDLTLVRLCEMKQHMSVFVWEWVWMWSEEVRVCVEEGDDGIRVGGAGGVCGNTCHVERLTEATHLFIDDADVSSRTAQEQKISCVVNMTSWTWVCYLSLINALHDKGKGKQGPNEIINGSFWNCGVSCYSQSECPGIGVVACSKSVSLLRTSLVLRWMTRSMGLHASSLEGGIQLPVAMSRMQRMENERTHLRVTNRQTVRSWSSFFCVDGQSVSYVMTILFWLQC